MQHVKFLHGSSVCPTPATSTFESGHGDWPLGLALLNSLMAAPRVVFRYCRLEQRRTPPTPPTRALAKVCGDAQYNWLDKGV